MGPDLLTLHLCFGQIFSEDRVPKRRQERWASEMPLPVRASGWEVGTITRSAPRGAGGGCLHVNTEEVLRQCNVLSLFLPSPVTQSLYL